MQQTKTKAIVLYQIKYNDNSIIVNLYSLDYGRIAIMVGGLSSKRGRNKLMYFSPLNILNIEIAYKEKRQIQRAKNIDFNIVNSEIPYKTSKTSIALFIAEILQKSLQEQESNPMLFTFLRTSIEILDQINKGLANFHLSFLIQISRYLGIFPVNNFSENNCFFDIRKGRFRAYDSISPFLLSKEESLIIHRVMQLNYTELNQLKIGRKQRFAVLESIIQYFGLHIEGFGEFNSLKVLNEIFND